MCKKLLLFNVTTAVVFLICPGFGPAAAEAGSKVVFVSFHGADDAPSGPAADVGFTEASDKGYTDLLKANGYDVSRYITTNTPDPNVLNAADLVIISRAIASPGYQNDGATAWNSITAPMMILGGYVLRSSRMGYTTGGTMVDTLGDVALTVNDPTHPIFAGVALDANETMVNSYAQGAVVLPTDGVTLSRGISINNDPADDEGTVLAAISESSADTGPVGGMVIAEWPAGATLEHSGGAGTDVLAGPRLVFLTGSREPSGVTGGDAAGLYDLYPDGEQMFLNAVDYMIPDAPKIIWVNEGLDNDSDGIQDDQGFIDLLTGAGYDVDVQPNHWQNLEGVDANDANDYVGELNAADLVIISRSTNSGNYDDGNEPTLWNSVTTPMINMSSHLIRSSRWLWFNSGDLLALIPDVTLASDPAHPIFAGVLDESGMAQLHDPNVGTGQSNFTLAADAGNGTVLATNSGLVSIAEWAAGTEFYADANQWAGGTRMFITAGTQEVAGTPQGGMNLSAAGQQLFLNAVDYMIPLAPVDPGTDNLRHHYGFDSDASDDVGGADGTLEGGAVIADGALLTTAQEQYLSLPGETIAINTYDEVTLAAWYTPEAGTNDSWSMLAYFGGTENDLGGNGLFITAARGDDVSRAAISVGNVDTPWSSESGANGPEYDDGLLHHMVGTFNGDVVLYLDGSETGRTATSETNDLAGIATTFSALAKGGYGGDPEWIGQIHEFSIYDRALSPAEVLFLYNQGSN